MPLSPGWGELALRLALGIGAGIMIGLNRGEHGHSAGLRTTLLVGLAATVAMIQVNLLLPMAGKAPDSFITNDLMRLPLGILSGMGFIGAGAILRRGDAVRGVTTAATLWMMTIIGLCFGGGQIRLGAVATALSFLILWGLKRFEQYLSYDLRATLYVTAEAGLPAVAEIVERLQREGYRARLNQLAANGGKSLNFDVSWRGRPGDPGIPDLLEAIRETTGNASLTWRMRGDAPV
jgi:putative Mg2+ transporter-C (MgtC) family protein